MPGMGFVLVCERVLTIGGVRFLVVDSRILSKWMGISRRGWGLFYMSIMTSCLFSDHHLALFSGEMMGEYLRYNIFPGVHPGRF